MESGALAQAAPKEDAVIIENFGLASSTKVLYPANVTRSNATILGIAQTGEAQAVFVTDVSPFHPVSSRWPDQPCDQGRVICDGVAFEVTAVETGLILKDSGVLHTDKDIQTRLTDENGVTVVAHVLTAEGQDFARWKGREISLEVDLARRFALCAGHTGSHLAAFALNKALEPLWKKDCARDSLGNRDFDKLAISASKVEPFASREVYRIGKSLKKKGFMAQLFYEDIPAYERAANQNLAQWLPSENEVLIECEAPFLESFRLWKTVLNDGTAEIPCGGTHLDSLGHLKSVAVTLERNVEKHELVAAITVALNENSKKDPEHKEVDL